MTTYRSIARKLAFVVSTAALLALLSLASTAQDKAGKLSEEFHQTYVLSADGRVKVSNINGPVHISVWDRNEVRVDAVKTAWSKRRLDEAEIKVQNDPTSISIWTKYPGRDHTWTSEQHDNPASVEYTLTVPRKARLAKIELINGGLDIHGAAGEVEANCINGGLKAEELSGAVRLSTINGPLRAQLANISTSSMKLSSINGTVSLTIPSDAKAEVEASTVHGSISSDFGLRVNNHKYVGHDLRGELGGGGTRIQLSNVNGPIDIHRANDGKPVSPVKDLSHADDDDDDTI